MGFFSYQVKALQDVEAAFEKYRKVCLAASCSSGKTLIGYGYADDYIQAHPDAKILILTHGQTLLRKQFDESSEDFESKIRPFCGSFKKIVVRNCKELHDNYDGYNVFITIPQSIQRCKIPHFDLVIVDEGHQFYFATDGMVKRIISDSGASRELVLTGTPSPFVAAGWPIIPIPMCDLFPEYIQDVIVELAASSYITKFEYDFNDSNELNEEGMKKLTRESTDKTLDSLLDFICKRATTFWKKNPEMAASFVKFPNWLKALKSLKKTFIACKCQNQADYVQDYFAKQGVVALKSISREQTSLEADEAFNTFKNDPDATVLIVVGRGILGFNMPELVNVVDMTLSLNIDRVFQLFSRTVRKSRDKKCQKLFLKVVPELIENHPGHDYYLHFMTAVLCMTGPEWFTKYDGKNFKELKIPSIKRMRSGSGIHVKRDPKKKGPPEIKVWLGMGSIQFFKNIYHKTNKGNYSYAWTTMGKVREELLGIQWKSKEAWEQRALETADKLIEWLKGYNGKPPSAKSKNKEERILGDWVSSQKQNKNGTGDGEFFKSVEKKLSDAGYPDIFEIKDPEQRALETADKLIEWLDGHKGRFPSSISKGEGVYLNNWVGTQRYNKKNQGPGYFFKSVEKKLSDAGYPDIFKSTEQLTLEKADKLITWLESHDGKLPSAKSKNKEERILGSWFSNLKSKHINQESCNLVEKIFSDAGYPDILKNVDHEQVALEIAEELIEWLKKHGGKYPQFSTDDVHEKKLNTWLYTQRKNKKEDRKGKFYRSVEKKLSDAGYPDVFKNDEPEQKALENADKLIKWLKSHDGKFPSLISNDKEEKFLHRWLCGQRQNKKGRRKGKFFQSVEKKLSDAGYPDVFKTQFTHKKRQ